jgi:glycosyltransferase involved in cell wall biosynthesis
VYNASLAQALARLGHEVHLFCQDRNAHELPWVRDGSVTVHVPDIGGLLPVFVPDRYEGFEVKTFPELTDAELDTYLGANVAAVREVVETLGGVDAALANHLIMGPVILARAGLSFALAVHGSDLSYTVLPHLERFRPYAEEGALAAAGILVGSGHIAERLRQAVDDPKIHAKVRLGPPGVDSHLFSPVAPADARARLLDLAAELRGRRPAAPSAWDRDVDHAADAIEDLAGASGPRVVFVGKLIVSKGVDLLLAAWPLVHAENPGARLLIVGFGEYEAGLRRLWGALEGGRSDEAREIARKGRGFEGGEEAPLKMLETFLADLPAGYSEAARDAAGSIAFGGRLEHDEVGALLPAADALVFPSTFPEAFGMVAAEAAAAGVLPVSAGHSGALEVSRALASGLPPEAEDLVSFPLDDDAVVAIATRLNAWLGLDPEIRERSRQALVETVRRLWSWERVARGVLAASGGQLDELPPVPSE